jgi:hypothetical protein
LRIECCSQRRLAIGAALIEFGDDSLQALGRQIIGDRQHQGDRFGEPVSPVAIGELMLDGGLGDLLDGLAGDRFGVDYDRPGSATVCRACGQVDADAAVGFFCVDCGSRSDAAVVPTRDWYAYTLTELGKRRLLSGDLRTLRSGEASNSAAFRILLQHCMHIQSRYGRPATILRLAYTRADEVQSSQGARALALTTRQAAEIVRGELRASDFMIEKRVCSSSCRKRTRAASKSREGACSIASPQPWRLISASTSR